MRRSLILTFVVAVALVAVAVGSATGSAQPIGDRPGEEPATSQADDGGGGVLTVIPGFYSVGAFSTGTGPAGIELDPATGYLWVVDSSGNNVDVVSHDGTIVMSVGSGSIGSADGDFNTPVSVAILDDEAYITDLFNDRVQVFDTSTGAHKRSFGSTVLVEPCGIAVSGTQVFVASAGLDEVVIFTTAGNFVTSFDGGVNGPIAQSCLGDLIDVDGSEIYVDGDGHRVVVFDLTGTWLREFTINGVGLSAIQVDDASQIWVGTYLVDTIEIYTSTGVFVAEMNESGAALGQLDLPRDIAIDPSGDTFWVTEDSNNRVQTFTRLLCDSDILTQVGTSYDDDFVGTSNDDTVSLGPGADTYRGLAGDDTVCAGPGNDDVRGGGGADKILAGDDDDVLLGQGGLDTLLGRGGNDTIDGNGAADTIDGGSGDDTLTGQNGGDTIDGGPGIDTLRGNTGPDTMSGEGGDDELFGGEGADVLYGGAGVDKCSGNTGPDSAEAATCETTPGVETLF